MPGDNFGDVGVDADTPDWVLQNPAGAEEPYGPPNPYAYDDMPGSYGPPSYLAPDAHVDVDDSAPEGSKDFDFGGLFASLAKTTGEVVKATVGQGLPAPVAAAAAAAAAAAKEEALRQQAAAKPSSQVVVAKTAPAATPVSTGALVALGLGGLGISALLALAGTRRGRR